MHENEISGIIVDAAFKIHTTLGPGLLESVYEVVLAHELERRGLHVLVQQPIPVIYEAVRLELGFRADIVVENKVVIEVKSVDGNRACASKTASHLSTINEFETGLAYQF